MWARRFSVTCAHGGSSTTTGLTRAFTGLASREAAPSHDARNPASRPPDVVRPDRGPTRVAFRSAQCRGRGSAGRIVPRVSGRLLARCAAAGRATRAAKAPSRARPFGSGSYPGRRDQGVLSPLWLIPRSRVIAESPPAPFARARDAHRGHRGSIRERRRRCRAAWLARSLLALSPNDYLRVRKGPRQRDVWLADGDARQADS